MSYEESGRDHVMTSSSDFSVDEENHVQLQS